MDNKVIKPKLIIQYQPIKELLPLNLTPIKKKLTPIKICHGQCDKCIIIEYCI